jgi:hypothetical protein
VLLGDVAVVNFTLSLCTQESRVRQDEPMNGCGDLTRYHSGSHAPHRVPQQNRSGKSDSSDESDDVARVIFVPIPMKWRARIPVSPGVRHHYVVFAFESACQRSPAGSVPGQSME